MLFIFTWLKFGNKCHCCCCCYYCSYHCCPLCSVTCNTCIVKKKIFVALIANRWIVVLVGICIANSQACEAAAKMLTDIIIIIVFARPLSLLYSFGLLFFLHFFGRLAVSRSGRWTTVFFYLYFFLYGSGSSGNGSWMGT